MKKIKNSLLVSVLLLSIMGGSMFLNAAPKTRVAVPSGITQVILSFMPVNDNEVATEVQSFVGVNRVSDNKFSGVAPVEIKGSLPVGVVVVDISYDAEQTWQRVYQFTNVAGSFNFRADAGNITSVSYRWTLVE